MPFPPLTAHLRVSILVAVLNSTCAAHISTFAGFANFSTSTTTSATERSATVAHALPSLSTSGSVAAVNASRLAAASACNDARWSWKDNWGQTFAYNTSFLTSTSSVSVTVTRSGWYETIPSNPATYTLCDGWPRVNASTVHHTLDTTIEQTSWETFTTTTPVSKNAPPPDCTIAPAQCGILQSFYTSDLSVYSSSRSAYYSGAATAYPTSPTSPICGTPTANTRMNVTLDPAACMVNTATIQLLYWPVQTVGNHLCGGNFTTRTATPTIPGQPNTAVGFSTTFTSPTVYMVLSGAYSVGEDYSTGSALQGILPLSSTAVSSLCGQVGGSFGQPQPVDYAHFDLPVPASAYRCQPQCFTSQDISEYWEVSTATKNLCSTIFDNYAPALAIPTAEFSSFFSNLENGVGVDERGMQCSLALRSDGIFYDPPKALQPVQAAAGPSVPGGAKTTEHRGGERTTPASPAQTLAPAIPGPSLPKDVSPNNTPAPLEEDLPPSTPPETRRTGPGPAPMPAPAPASAAISDKGQPTQSATSNLSGSPGPADPQPGQHGADGSANPPAAGAGSSTTSRNVGEVIASVFGIGRPANSGVTEAPGRGLQEQGTASSDASSATNYEPAHDRSDARPADPPAAGNSGSVPVTGAVLTGSNGAHVTAVFSGQSVVLSQGTLRVGKATSIAGIGKISALAEAIGQTLASSSIASAPAEPAGHGQTHTAEASFNGVIAPGVTLTPGGAAVTYSGSTYLLAPSANELVVNGITQAPSFATPTRAPLLTCNGQTYTAKPNGDYSIGPGKTLRAGSAVMVDGTTLSLDPSATAVFIDGQTLYLKSATSATLRLAVDGTTPTEDSAGDLLLENTLALSPGSVVTVSRNTISLATTGSVAVINGVATTMADGPVHTSTLPAGSVSAYSGFGIALQPPALKHMLAYAAALVSLGVCLL